MTFEEGMKHSIKETEREKCELLGIIQEKDKAIKELVEKKTALEKRCFELETENSDLQQKYLEESFEKSKLVKENAELKKQQFSLRNERNTFLVQNEQYEKDLIDFNENLIKAKEIIENIIRVTWGEGWNYSLDWKVKAEQFLKEIE